MQSDPEEITYEVVLQPGEPLTLPKEAAALVGPGRWLVSIRPFEEGPAGSIRNHHAFLNSYSPEDEGLYDDYSAG
ncbi:MAG: hypothetical protein WD669_07340 [Pirellulales bacterium]